MRYLTFIFILVFSLANKPFAQDNKWQEFMLAGAKYDVNSMSTNESQNLSGMEKKSIKKPALMSVVVPGAGQVYNGSYYKGLGFLAIEAVSWTMYITYNNEGNDIEDEFHGYANTHWSEQDYWKYVAHHSGIEYTGTTENIEALRVEEGKLFSHGLHREKDQQYYEMIGKYDQFNYGWDDYDKDLIGKTVKEMQSLRSSKRLYYEGRRDDSNQAFKKATTGATIALFNHIFSALEAAWSVNKYNKTITAQMNMEPLHFNNQYCSALTLRMTW